MSNFLKRFLSLTIILAIAFSTFSFTTLAANNTKLTVNKSHVATGDTVKLTVTVSVKNIYSTNLTVKYNNKAFKYVSGASSGGSGTAKIAEVHSGQDKLKFTLSFRSLKAGTFTFSVSGNVGVQNKNGTIAKDISVSSNKVKVTVHSCKTVSIKKKATLTKTGSAVKKCSKCGRKITSPIRKIKTVKFINSTYTYNGKTKKPTVKAYDSAGIEIPSKYFAVKYPESATNVGKHKLTVTFKTKYKASKTLYFTILPPETKVLKLTSGKQSVKVYISKKTKQVSGYQIQYSRNKNFKSAKTKTVSGYKNTTATIKSLSAKKIYCIRVRTYKTVGDKKYYSAWSNYSYVQTK